MEWNLLKNIRTFINSFFPTKNKDNFNFLDFDSSKEKKISSVNLAFAFKYSGYFALIPDNLDLDSHFQRYPLTNYMFREFEGKIATVNKKNEKIYFFDKDRMIYLLGLISEIPAQNKDSISEDGFVSIYSRLIQTWFRDYKNYLDYLVNTGVFICNEHYVIGKISIGYKFSPVYEESELTPFYYNHKKDILTQEIISDSLIEFPYLSYWYNQKKLNVNQNKAIKYASLVMKRKFDLGIESWDKNKEKWNDKKQDLRKYPRTQYNAVVYNITSINIKDYKVKIDNNVHRLHSVLTNIQKDYRNFISYEGEQLVSIDISNSQPYLLCLLFNPFFWQENTESLNLFNLPKDIQDRFTKEHLDKIKKYTETLQIESLCDYKRKASEGQIYEYIKDISNEELKANLTRGDTKVMMLIVFFSKNKFFNQPDAKLKKLFNKIYPSIYDLIKLIKEIDHASLACLLQALESHLILHKCCKRIWQEGNHLIPIFTIHDSIVTTVENKDFVKQIMLEELTKAIGLSPNLEEEIWSESKLKDQDLLAQTHIF